MVATARSVELRAIAQGVADALPTTVEEAVLTGSVSRGVADDVSDIEMLVVTTEPLELAECFEHTRRVGLVLHPTFVAFTPWTTAAGYRDLLRAIARLDLIEHVSPVQLAIRLLIPRGSLLLELEEVRALVGPFDDRALVHPWRHPDPRIDGLQAEVEELVAAAAAAGESRGAIFARVWERAGLAAAELPRGLAPRHAPVPFLTEPWYC